MNKPLAFYYSWQDVPDQMIPNIMAEFSWNGAENLVFSHVWLHRILREPSFASILFREARRNHLNLISAHGILGQGYDLCCPDRGRRDDMIRDHIRALGYCADAGCKTYTVHVGAFESVYYGTPNEVLRPFVLDTLEKLLPTLEKYDMIMAVENAYERSNSPEEVVYYVEKMQNEHIQCCYDTGHAHCMEHVPGKIYRDEMNLVWNNHVEEYEDAVGKMGPHIVTCHMHDNDGGGDDHLLPGLGNIDWKTLIPKLKKCPRLKSMQTEVRTNCGLPIGKVVRKFNELLKLE